MITQSIINCDIRKCLLYEFIREILQSANRVDHPVRNPNLYQQEPVIMKAIYTRINNKKDTTKYERQLELCRSYLEDGESAVYFHDVTSGLNTEADGLAALMNEVENGTITHVIVQSIDRIARKMVMVNTVLEKMQRYGITVIFADDGTIIDNVDKYQYILALNEYARRIHASRVKQGIADAKERRARTFA